MEGRREGEVEADTAQTDQDQQKRAHSGTKKTIKEGNAVVLFAKQIGIGKTTINKVEYLISNCDERTLEKLRSGELSVHKQYDLMRGCRSSQKTASRPKTQSGHIRSAAQRPLKARGQDAMFTSSSAARLQMGGLKKRRPWVAKLPHDGSAPSRATRNSNAV